MAEVSSHKFSDIFHVHDWPDGRDVFGVVMYGGEQVGMYGRHYGTTFESYVFQDVKRGVHKIISSNIDRDLLRCWFYLDDLYQFAISKGVVPVPVKKV